MSIALSQQSFLANALGTPPTHKPKTRILYSVKAISCRHPPHDHQDSPRKSDNQVGGQAFRSPAPRSAPRVNNNSRTNIYINPPVAPPLVGGYGYGYGVPFFGGWGWSPFSFFAPAPGVAVGVGGGFDVLALFLFLGAAAAVVRRFLGSRDDDSDY
ncbi:hypothetical protein SLA2020_277210 [Shorea laevis]